MKYFVLSLMLLGSTVAMPAWAKPRAGTGSSSKPIVVSSSECMQTALNGKIEGECSEDPEADNCVGMKQALKNSLRREQCRARAGQGCLIYGYRQNTQAQWVSVAAAYLAEALNCVKNQYGTDDSNGFREAMADPIFRAKLSRLSDGAGAFGLPEGDMLSRSLRGENLVTLLRTSPAWSGIEVREQERMATAAEQAASLAEAESESFPRLKSSKASSTAEQISAANVYTKQIIIAEKAAAENLPPERSLASTAQLESNSRVFVRNIKNNPYSLGLDLTLFDRVSSAYQKRGHDLRGMEEFVKGLPPKQPRDVRDLIRRGAIGSEL